MCLLLLFCLFVGVFVCLFVCFHKAWYCARTLLSAAKLTLFKTKRVSTRLSAGKFLTSIPSTVAEITRPATIRWTPSTP